MWIHKVATKKRNVNKRLKKHFGNKNTVQYDLNVMATSGVARNFRQGVRQSL